MTRLWNPILKVQNGAFDAKAYPRPNTKSLRVYSCIENIVQKTRVNAEQLL